MSLAAVTGLEPHSLLCKRLGGIGESIDYLRQKQLGLDRCVDFIGIYGQYRKCL